MFRKLFECVSFKLAEDSKGLRMDNAEAFALCEEVIGVLVSLGIDRKDVYYGGSLRRGTGLSVGDLDIAICDPRVNKAFYQKVKDKMREAGHEVGESYTDVNRAGRRFGHGDSQMSMNVDNRTVELKRCTPEELPFMLIHITGSGRWNMGIRAWLVRYNWHLSSKYLMNDKGEKLHADTEEDVFKLMGIPYIAPPLRGEFQMPTHPPGEQKQIAAAPEPGIPEEVLKKVPAGVQAKLKDLVVPKRDEGGVVLPPDFLWSKDARQRYYKSRGRFKIADEFKLDRY